MDAQRVSRETSALICLWRRVVKTDSTDVIKYATKHKLPDWMQHIFKGGPWRQSRFRIFRGVLLNAKVYRAERKCDIHAHIVIRNIEVKMNDINLKRGISIEADFPKHFWHFEIVNLSGA